MTYSSLLQNLYILEECIMIVCIPIKINNNLKDDAKNIFEMKKKSHYLSAEMKIEISPVILHIDYFANPKNMC